MIQNAFPIILAVAQSLPVFSDPTHFTNEFMPFEAGVMKVYFGRAEEGRLVVVDTYLAETRVFDLWGAPVECVTLQETEYVGGELVEISLNYFAQADDGTVYTFGEVVNDYEAGEAIAHEGSWLVGGAIHPTDPVETAVAIEPAVFMDADPQVGDTWKPDDLFPLADETVEVLATDVKVKVPAAKFEGVMLVEETGEAPDIEIERKWYAPKVGVIKASSRGEKLRLVATRTVED